MRKNGRDNRPHVKPVTRIELSEKNIKIRWIAIIVLLSIGVIAIGAGLFSALNVQNGWQTVEVSSDQPNCGADFALMYDFSDSGSAATTQLRQITAVYSEACENAFRIFSADVQEEGLLNVRYINDHVNEAIRVDPDLYQVFALIAQYGDRHVFLAPVNAEYDRVFLSDNDGDAAIYDPARNTELVPYIQEAAAFANDPEKIGIELLGDNQLRLHVSEDYLAFAGEYGIETFVEFGWMENAFIADYLAKTLQDNGFTTGYLASFDGFTRNLDTRGQAYSVNVFDRQGDGIYLPVRMHYTQPMSIVFLRNYPMVEQDRWHYYSFENGDIVTAFLDPADGMSKSAADNLAAYSGEAGCAEILLQIAPVFIADDFRTDALNALTEKGVYSVWCEDSTICYNDAEVSLELLSVDAPEQYHLSFAK